LEKNINKKTICQHQNQTGVVKARINMQSKNVFWLAMTANVAMVKQDFFKIYPFYLKAYSGTVTVTFASQTC